MPQTAKVGIRVLGGFSVEHDGVPVDPASFGGRLAATLVKILVTRRGEVATREGLCEMLWPDVLPADPGANLNALVHRARGALGVDDAIRTTAGGYRLDRQQCQIDAELFLDAVSAAQADTDEGRDGVALRRLTEALDLWHGDPLPDDAYAAWSEQYRASLARVHREALETAAETALARGDVRSAVGLAQQAAAGAELEEKGHRLLARARIADGDRAGALAVLDSLRDRLRDELGVDPTAQSQRLRQQILRDELDEPRRPRPPAGGRGMLPFVGRDGELSALTTLAEEHGGGVALVAGRAGSGKSRLLSELVAAVAVPTFTARAFLPERTTPWALARTLLVRAASQDADIVGGVPARARAALATVLPELVPSKDRADDRLEPETRRALALEGGLRLLERATAGGALLVLDDLQWADASSVQLLASALHRLDGVALALAFRPEEVRASPAADLIEDIRSSPDVVKIELGRLARQAIAEIVADTDLTDVLSFETDGSPFAVGQALAALDGEGLVHRGVAGAWHPSSDRAVARARTVAREGMRRSLVARLSRQPGTSRDLLAHLALVGRESPTGLLATAARRTEAEVLADLEALAKAELVRLGERGWAPAHDLLGEAVAEDLTPPQRAAGHLAIARALRTRPATPGERAHHLLGAGDPVAAAGALAVDARAQLDAHADREAARLADAALELDPPGHERVELLEIRAEAYNRLGSLDASRQDLREALARTDEPSRRARILAGLAMLSVGGDDLGHASELVELALVESVQETAPRARVLAVASIIDMNLERGDRAAERAREAERLFRGLGDSHGVADVLDARAMAVFLDGQIGLGIKQFERVARLYHELGDLVRVITPRSTRGHGLLFAGHPEAGLAETDAALDLALDLGSSEGEAYVRWHRSEVLTGCGRYDDALEDAERALVLAEQLGHRGWTATAHLARGVARRDLGDLPAAEEAFRSSLDTSSELPLFACWAHARLARVLIEQGRLEAAASQVRSAGAQGPGLGQYETRLAEALLACARAAPDASTVVAAALRSAREGGHEFSAHLLDGLSP